MQNQLLIVANWKANKNIFEAISWVSYFNDNKDKVQFSNKKIVICPSLVLLSEIKKFIEENNLEIYLGAQDISPFPEGAYTGATAGGQIKNLVSYVLVGHSERRKYFKESQVDIENKLIMAKDEGLESILCVQDSSNPVPKDTNIIAYEPIFAIGTGDADTPKNIEKTLGELINNTGKTELLYGGSVDKQNIKELTKIPALKGFLIGGASLDPANFISLLQEI